MLVVSDAGPLHYLTLIAHVDKLPALYGAAAMPESVASELSHDNTPAPVRAFMAARPPWLTIHSVSGTDADLDTLGRGERDAIFLASELHADLLLCDDLLARKLPAHATSIKGSFPLGTLVKSLQPVWSCPPAKPQPRPGHCDNKSHKGAGS